MKHELEFSRTEPQSTIGSTILQPRNFLRWVNHIG